MNVYRTSPIATAIIDHALDQVYRTFVYVILGHDHSPIEVTRKLAEALLHLYELRFAMHTLMGGGYIAYQYRTLTPSPTN